MQYSKNIQIALATLRAEVSGDVQAALHYMADDYVMTWMYQSRDGTLFPRSAATKDALVEEMHDIYAIKDRQYDIRHITEAGDTVILELIESYTDPRTGVQYRTPEVIVLEFSEGLIVRGRHYTDPRLSHMRLTAEQIDEAGLGHADTQELIS